MGFTFMLYLNKRLRYVELSVAPSMKGFAHKHSCIYIRRHDLRADTHVYISEGTIVGMSARFPAPTFILSFMFMCKISTCYGCIRNNKGFFESAKQQNKLFRNKDTPLYFTLHPQSKVLNEYKWITTTH